MEKNNERLDKETLNGEKGVFNREVSEEMRKAYLDYAMSVICLLYTSPSPRDLSTSRMPSSA